MSWDPSPTQIMKDAFKIAHTTFPEEEGGLCLEFGVGMGRSFCWQALSIMNDLWAQDSVLIGFDSFQGLSSETEGVWAPDRHREGQFAYALNVVHEHMGLSGIPLGDPRFCLIEGFFTDSLTAELQTRLRALDSKLIFVNIDVDIHSSTIEALDFIRPMLRSGVVIHFDDYRDPIDDLPGVKDPSITEWGENLAWREWTEQNNVSYDLGDTNDLNQRYYTIT